MVKLFSYHGEYFFLPLKTFFFPWRKFFLTKEDFFLSMEDFFFLPWKVFLYHGENFFFLWKIFSYHGENFFFPLKIFLIKTISLTPTKWVIIGRPPRGQREQGRLVEGEVAREASQRARHHATEARAGGGMRDWA